MKKKSEKSRSFLKMLGILFVMLLFVGAMGCGKTEGKTDTATGDAAVVASVDDLPGKRIGV